MPFTVPINAQESAQLEGINRGNYNVQQSIEFGYRHSDFSGSRSVYDTFVNLDSGPRLLDYTLGMRSLDHQGKLFDNLFLTGFGYGGDPNNLTQLRVSKNRWFNFGGTFRRDTNHWDYNLLANPLNPTNSTPSNPITESPHRFRTVRRMSNFNLTVLPQSQVRFRLGYARSVHEGPSFSSFHEGTETLIFQQWKTTTNAYRAGIDVQLIPRTNISYDQFWNYYKGDTAWVDENFAFRLSDGSPVDLGLIFNTPARQPCASPIADTTTNPPTADSSCNAFQAYSRSGPARASYPTEQLSFQSRYFERVDLSGRASYSSSENDVPNFEELFRGLASRTNLRQLSASGPASSKRVSVTLDWAATWHVTDALRVVNAFHLADFRIPGQWLFSESSLFGPSMVVLPNVFDPATCNLPSVTSGCPQHTNSSPADVVSGSFSLFLGQKERNNQFELQYDFLPGLSGRLGYRFRHRFITFRESESHQEIFFPTLPNRGACAGQPLQADGSCQVSSSDERSHETEINEHSLLMGVQARPMDTLRMNFDLELMSADNAFTRISPRHRQHYKGRAQFKPTAALALNGGINILENRHNVTDVNNLQHNRSYGFGVVVEPIANLGVDFGYDYNDVFSQTNICFVASVQPSGSTTCPASAAFLQQISLYENQSHYGYGNIAWTLTERLAINVGYSVVSAAGNTLILSPNAPPGPLQFRYHKPHAGFSAELARGLQWRTTWGYYGYNEESDSNFGVTARDFRGNLVTISLRHSF
jgi:hypothetical protein